MSATVLLRTSVWVWLLSMTGGSTTQVHLGIECSMHAPLPRCNAMAGWVAGWLVVVFESNLIGRISWVFIELKIP